MIDYSNRCRHRAAVHGYTAIVKLLLESKCRVNPKDSEGNTPLHLACEEGHGGTAVLLLENGGNADQPNSEGKTPLDMCRTSELKKFIEEHSE